MKIESGGDAPALAPTDLVISHFDAGQHRRVAPSNAIPAGHEEEAPGGGDAQRPAAAVAGMEEEEALAGNVPGLRVGEVGHENALELVYAPGFGAAMNVGGPARAMGRGKNPEVAAVVHLKGWIVVGILRVFVEEEAGAGHLAGFVIVVRHHVEQLLLVGGMPGRGAAINEKGLLDFLAVDGNGGVLLGVGGKAAAVFVFEFVPGGLVVVPDAAVSVLRLQLAAGWGRLGRVRRGGRRRQGGRGTKEERRRLLGQFGEGVGEEVAADDDHASGLGDFEGDLV